MRCGWCLARAVLLERNGDVDKQGGIACLQQASKLESKMRKAAVDPAVVDEACRGGSPGSSLTRCCNLLQIGPGAVLCPSVWFSGVTSIAPMTHLTSPRDPPAIPASRPSTNHSVRVNPPKRAVLSLDLSFSSGLFVTALLCGLLLHQACTWPC